jgi:general secretion pathway protein E
MAELGDRFGGEELFGPGSCAACHGTGYAGRTGIYELFGIDEEAKRLIHAAGAEQQLRAHAVDSGMRTLREDGLRWVLAGVTSLEEVVRVTRET